MQSSPDFLLVSPRGVITGVFFAFGAAVGLWSGAIPSVTKASAVDDITLGLALTCYTLTYVLTMFFGGTLARFATNRTILLWALPVVAIAGIVLLLAASPLLFFASLAFFGAMLGLLDLFMNAEGSYIEADLKRPVFTAFHGSASAGVAIFAIIGSILSVGVGIAATAVTLAVAMAGGWWLAWRFLPGRHLAMVRGARLSALPRLAPLVLLGLAAGLVIAAETAALMWSAKLLNEQASRLAAIAGVGASFFGLCTAAVRFSGDFIRARLGDIALILASLIVAIAGFALVGLSRDFWLSVGAFALVGFGTACVIPLIFALSAGYMEANRAAGIGFVSLVAGIPRTLAPWVFGWVAGSLSTSFAFGLCAAGLAVALCLIIALRNLGK